jgi:hypothetical protein
MLWILVPYFIFYFRVGDVVGGPNLEIIVGDMGGTIACIDTEAEIVWDRR